MKNNNLFQKIVRLFWFVLIFITVLLFLPPSRSCLFSCNFISSPILIRELPLAYSSPNDILTNIFFALLLEGAYLFIHAIAAGFLTWFIYKFCKAKNIRLWYLGIIPILLILAFITYINIVIPYLSNKALFLKDPIYCEKILSFKDDLAYTPKGNCYDKIAEKYNIVASCKSDQCLNRVARQLKEPSICFNYVNLAGFESCIKNTSGEVTDVALCEIINKRAVLEKNTRYQQLAFCYISSAKHDKLPLASYCDRMKDNYIGDRKFYFSGQKYCLDYLNEIYK